MPLFTTENAAEMGKRGAIARWTEPERPAFQPALAEPNPQQAELARTREHIELINQQLDSCSDPDEWDCLTRSKERLFRIWARLAQIPTDPKPSSAKPRQAMPRPMPTAPCGPEGQAEPGTPQ